MKIQYMVIPVERFMAVRFEKNDEGKTHKSEVCGEFANASLAYSAAAAMTIAERTAMPEGVTEVLLDSDAGWLQSDLKSNPSRFTA